MTRPVSPRLCTCGHRWAAHEGRETLDGPAPCDSCPCPDFQDAGPVRRRGRPEADVRRAVARELTLAGFKRYVIQGRYDPRYGTTGNSVGVPDEYYLHPMTGEAFWWEAKAITGRHRAGQVEFARLHQIAADRANATRRDLPPSVHCWCSIAQAVEYLTTWGYRAVVDGKVVYPHASGAE